MPTKSCHGLMERTRLNTTDRQCMQHAALEHRGFVSDLDSRLGIVSVIIMAAGRVKPFLKELPAGQRVAPKGEKNQHYLLYI